MDGSSVLVMFCAVFTTLCKALRLRAVQLPYRDAASQDTLYGAPVEGQDALYGAPVEGQDTLCGAHVEGQDALYGEPVEVAEYLGVHVEHPQPTERRVRFPCCCYTFPGHT